MKRRVQVFVHRYYESIKLTLLVFLVLLGVFTILTQIDRNNKEDQKRDADTAQIISENKATNDEQTDVINRQFRALCILLIETSGQEGLNKLDEESRKRCENLDANEPTAPVEESQTTEQGSQLLGSQSNSASSSFPDDTQNGSNQQPDTSQNPSETSDDESFLQTIDEPLLVCAVLPLLRRVCQ